LLGYRCEQLRLDQGRHRDGDLLGRRRAVDRIAPARVFRLAT
jgi:hypothetical protein